MLWPRSSNMQPGPDLPAVALFSAFLLASCGGESVLAIGIGGAGSGGTGGMVDTSGTGGTAPATPFGCDLDEALVKSCGRTGCHSAAAHYAGLDLTSSSIGPSLVDKPASFGDIDCAVAPEPFRPCTPAELPSSCPTGALLIDSQDREASWMLRKLDPSFVPDTCGVGMPAPPGNGTAAGWSDQRRACIVAWINSLAASAR